MQGSVGGSSFQSGRVAQGCSVRGICHPPHIRLGRGMLEGGVHAWGMGRGSEDRDEVAQTERLQSGNLLVLRREERKGFVGPELQNLVT